MSPNAYLQENCCLEAETFKLAADLSRLQDELSGANQRIDTLSSDLHIANQRLGVDFGGSVVPLGGFKPRLSCQEKVAEIERNTSALQQLEDSLRDEQQRLAVG